MIRHYLWPARGAKNTPKRPHFRKAFTIVELLVIIAVIVILAAITIVSYTAVTNNAKKQTVKTDAVSIAAELTKYKTDNGVYPDQAAFNAMNKPSVESSFQYTYDSTNNTYCLTSSVDGASVYITSGNSSTKEGGCEGHGLNGDPAVTNYAYNPGAEVNAGWFSNNGATYTRSIDTAVKRTGAQSMRMQGVSAGPTLLTMYGLGGNSGNGNVVPAPGAGTYTQSAYFRANVAHTGRLTVSWRVGGAWSTAASSETITGTSGQWTRVTQEFTLPDNVEFVRSGAYVVATASQPAGTPAWIDDFMLVRGTKMPGYADGSKANWLWTGTPNDSPSYGPAL
ncbi:MAG: type IV pilin protein [Candidatus Microsaccharimonas sp.]